MGGPKGRLEVALRTVGRSVSEGPERRADLRAKRPRGAPERRGEISSCAMVLRGCRPCQVMRPRSRIAVAGTGKRDGNADRHGAAVALRKRVASASFLMRGRFAKVASREDQTIVADRVEALIGRLAPAAICDECIVERLSLSALHQASQRTRELAGMRGYERCDDECAICGEAKPVIRRRLAV